jgi:hypothetical protein
MTAMNRDSSILSRKWEWERGSEQQSRRQERGGRMATPSCDFVKWWGKHPTFKEGVDAFRAWNCRCYREEWETTGRLSDGATG